MGSVVACRHNSSDVVRSHGLQQDVGLVGQPRKLVDTHRQSFSREICSRVNGSQETEGCGGEKIELHDVGWNTDDGRVVRRQAAGLVNEW